MPPNSQYLSTILNDPSAAPSTNPPPHTTTPPRPRAPPTHAHHHPPTAAQLSAQARGKPLTTRSGPRRPASPENYASRQRRDEAAAILDSQEMLLWYAAARHESVAQTRQWYLNVVLGVEQPSRAWREEWEVRREEEGGASAGASPRGKGRKGKEKEKEKERGKLRYSSGGGGGGGPDAVMG